MPSEIKKTFRSILALLYAKFVFNIYVKILKFFLPKKFIIQDRPANHFKLNKMPDFGKLEKVWSDDRAKPQTDIIRLYFLYLILHVIRDNKLEGSMAEVGVFRGHSASIINQLFPDKKLYLFDTFCGFEEADVSYEAKMKTSDARKGQFENTSENIVRKKLSSPRDVIFCPGNFPDTAPMAPEDEKFCFVHFDADLYKPAKSTCEYFFPRLVEGGVMVFHDYNNTYTGVKEAVDGYFSPKGYVPLPIPDQGGSAVIIKRG